MQKIIALRPLNLLIIIFTVLCLRFLLVEPILFAVSSGLNESIEPQLNYFQLIALILTMVLIAAGGYVANDIADVEIDKINKPGKNIIGSHMSQKNALNLYYSLTGLGIVISLGLAIYIWNYNLAIVQTAVAVSLYFYAFHFKKSFFPGNFIVALVVAAVPFTYGVYEIIPLQEAYIFIQEKHPEFNFNFLAYWILGFTAFAFVITLTREITKDIQDIKGDSQFGSKSLPAIAGITASKIALIILYSLCIWGLTHLHFNYIADGITLFYFIGLGILFMALIIFTNLAKTPRHFAKVSALNKIVTLLGVLYTVVVAYMMYGIES